MIDLNGMTILIGKEPGQGRLMVSTKINGQVRSAFIGNAGSVPDCVSRCRPAEDIAHCKIEASPDGTMILVNLKPQNVTYVNGREIVSKKITADSRVELGRDRYRINIGNVLDSVRNIAGAQHSPQQPQQQSPLQAKSVKEYSILPLKKIWNAYNDEIFDLQKRQKSLAVVKSLYLPLTVLSTLVGMAAKHMGLQPEFSAALSYTMYAIAAVVLFYGLFRTITDKSLEQKMKITEKFQDNYVCPNPDCRHFMGNQPYKILRQNSCCPYCKCKFVEK